MPGALAIAATAEAATGAALIGVPSIVARLLLGVELSGGAAVVGRVAGIALIGLAVACWPNAGRNGAALIGMTLYGLLVTVYLSYLGIRGEWVGPLLWPAVTLHAALVPLLLRERRGTR